MNFDFTHFFQYLSFFLKNCNFAKKGIFTKILRFFKLFLGLIIRFGALVCKFGNKNVFLMLWPFLEKGLLATSLLSTSVPSTFLYLCPVRYKSYRYFLKNLNIDRLIYVFNIL